MPISPEDGLVVPANATITRSGNNSTFANATPVAIIVNALIKNRLRKSKREAK